MRVVVIIGLLGAGLYQLNDPEEWQYTIISPDDSKLRSELDKAGALGWEIVSTRRASSGDAKDAKFAYEMIMKKRGASPTTPASFLEKPKGE